MRTVRTIVVVSLLLCSALIGGLAAAGPIGVSTGPQADLGPAVNAQTNGTVDGSDGPRNGSLGGEVSSFMQITAANAEGAVDSGMWRASVNDSENESERDAEITARIEYLWERFDEINAEKADLRQNRTNNSSVSHVARASRLAARIDSFQSAVNQTVELAAEQNVNETEAARLEAAAASLGTPNLPAVDEDLATGATPSARSPPPTTRTPVATPTPVPTATPTTTTATTTATTTETTTATTTATTTTATPANTTETQTATPTPTNTTTATPTPTNTTTTTATTTAVPTATDTPVETGTEAPTTTTPTDGANGGDDDGSENESDGARGGENGSTTASVTTTASSTATNSPSTATASTTTAAIGKARTVVETEARIATTTP